MKKISIIKISALALGLLSFNTLLAQTNVGRLGIRGEYNSTQVQGIWSIGNGYKISTANNNFGNQFGMGYAYNGLSGSISGWSHQILFLNAGSVTASISSGFGHAYFKGSMGIGTKTPTAKLDIQGGANKDGTGDPKAVAFQWHNGGYRHWIRTRHNGNLSQAGNAIDFYVNNSSVAGGSTGPGAGSQFVMTMNSGNVGIGTTDPTEKLDVQGNLKVSGQLDVQGDFNWYASKNIKLKDPGEFSFDFADGDGNDRWHVWDPVHGSILTIRNNGRVGIGSMTAPAELLELKNNKPVMLFHSPGVASYKIGNDGNIFKIAAMDNGKGGHTGNFEANDDQILAMNKFGNVGIGTTDPGNYKLAVEGNIGAREVEVKTGSWADFVFGEEYELQSLEEVENYIKTNKHLPDVPSEAEVLENGINLGKMDAILLQKIEELTLYVIELKKENQRRQQENATLKERIDVLEAE